MTLAPSNVQSYVVPLPSFQVIEPNNYIAVFASYVENHETKLIDLLDDKFLDPIKRTYVNKKICDLPTSEHAYVKDLTEVEVRSAQEALDVINMGQKRRKTAATALNSESSRGHAVFTLKFVHTPRANVDRANADPTAYTVSQLSLVDLAGSERLARTGNQGRLRNEASECLLRCVLSLSLCVRRRLVPCWKHLLCVREFEEPLPPNNVPPDFPCAIHGCMHYGHENEIF